jgi:dTDP-4-amino-4,6-dideoxygalactose transaminase
LGTAAIGAGYQIVLYDVEPGTLAPDWESLQRCLAAGASHVVAAHLFGRLVDVAEVQRVAAPYGAVVIEDAAQHAGGSLRGVRGGALADWSVLSFGRGKGINAGGGGALLRGADGCAAGAGLADLPAGLSVPDMRASLVGVVKATAAELLSHPAVYWLPAAIPALQLGATVYHVPSVARAMTATSALLLIEALDQEPAALVGRTAAERQYLEGLRAVTHDGTPMIPLYAAAEMASGALRVPVRLGREIAERLAPRGVVRSYPRTLADYPEILERVVHRGEALPGARLLADSLYTLPTHARLRDAERAEIIRILQVQR